MKKFMLTLLLLPATVLAAPTYYLGGGLGMLVGNVAYENGDEFNAGAYGGKIYGGMKFNDYIGIEGQYNRFFRTEVETNGSVHSVFSGWGFDAVGYLPVTEIFTIAGHAGFLSWQRTTDLPGEPTRKGITPHLGAGFQFNVFKHFSIRSDLDFYFIDMDGNDIGTGTLTVGGQFNF